MDGDSKVFRSPIASAQPVQVGTAPDGATLARQTADTLFLGTPEGPVHAMPKVGGGMTTYNVLLNASHTFAIDETAIYYQEKQELGSSTFALPLGGSPGWQMPRNVDDPLEGFFVPISPPALDGTYAYFGAIGFSGQTPGVYRKRKDGYGNVEFVLQSYDTRAHSLVMVGDTLVGATVIYGEPPAKVRVWSSSAPFETTTTLFTTTGGSSSELLNVGDEYVYWFEVSGRTIWRTSAHDGQTLRMVTLDEPMSSLFSIAIAGPHLYYRNYGPIYRIAR